MFSLLTTKHSYRKSMFLYDDEEGGVTQFLGLEVYRVELINQNILEIYRMIKWREELTPVSFRVYFSKTKHRIRQWIFNPFKISK